MSTEPLQMKDVEFGTAIEKIEKNEGGGEMTPEMQTKDEINIEKPANPESHSFTTDFNLILHTGAAYAIFTGEWAPGKMGLRQFGRHVQALWQGYEQDDPYAEWQLAKIYEGIQTLKLDMETLESLLRKQIRSLRGIQVKPFRNGKPFTAAFTSVHILVLRAAELITHVDYLIRQSLILKQLGVAPVGQAQTNGFREDMQKMYVLSADWKQSGITRPDMIENNAKAKKAEKQFGQIPEAILLQQTSLPFLSILSLNE